MRSSVCVLALLFLTSTLQAQDRDTKVRNDRKAFAESKDWIYNNLGEGVRAAKESGKPLLVVFRCIPCEGCQEFDDDVARRDPIIRDLLDKFVCVRIVQANTIDLTHFQHDFDQSFAAYLMNPDMTIYGRFATRSDRPEFEDISLEGLRKAMQAALRIHQNYDAVKPLLAGKQVKQSRYKTPLDYPSLSGKYGEKLDYEGKVTKSCIHCHQVRDAERVVYRSAKEPMPDDVVYPYPDPEVLGMKLDPEAMARVRKVAMGSIASKAGLREGDEIVTLSGQPMLSIADVQWVLHNAPSTAKIPAKVRREDKVTEVTIDLPEGWRRGNIAWRATSWDLRRMGLGGLRVDAMTDEERRKANVPPEGMALRVRHVGEYGEHAAAKNAGFLKGDVITSYDGQSGKMTESDLMAYAVQKKKAGDEVAVKVLRNGAEKVMRFKLQ